MKATLFYSTSLAVLLMLFSTHQALGQDNGWTGTTGDWSVGGNWEFGVPEPTVLDGRAVIDNGGTVTVSTNVAASPTVVLGTANFSGGTLSIGTGGTLNVVTGVGDPNVDPGAGEGKVIIGLNGGLGAVSVTSSGTLTVADEISLPTTTNANSSLAISGTGSVSAASAFLDKNFSISSPSGPSANLTVTGNAILGLGGTHAWQLPAAGLATSTVSVGGDVDLGGTLALSFTGGAPAVGSTWNLVDSTTVDSAEGANPSSFSFIDQSGVLGLMPGQSFAVSTVAGGTNGALTQLSLEQHPVLVVDRQSGAMQIKNFGSSATVDFDQYTVRSPNGFLNQGDWTSLQSQAQGTWVEANPGPTALSELEQLGMESLAGSASLSLGNAFDQGMPMALGDVTEDLTFEFTKPGKNTPIQGQVVYTGNPIGNVVLTVDPTTGEAQFRNNSPFTIEIDTYAIESESGALQEGDSDWSSLQDQSVAGGDWIEANIGPNQLSELQQLGTTTLEPGTAYQIGSPFNTLGKQDLSFKYALASEDFLRDGIVDYAELPTLFTADFEGDGNVDGADLADWQSSYAVDAGADANFDAKSNGFDFLVWQRQFGSMTPTAAAEISAVPEPTSVWLALSGVALLFGRFRKKD